MISLTVDRTSKNVDISFGGENFQEILDILKSSKLFKYNVEERLWTGSIPSFFSIKSDLEDIENIYIKNDEDFLYKHKRLVRETLFERSQLQENLLMSSPIEGKGEYKDFQTMCIKKGVSQSRLCYFLGMGTGKTFITISVLNHRFEKKEINRILIVSPSEGVYNWRRELLTFSNFLKKEDIIISTANNEYRYPFDSDAKVIIMTYRHFLTISDDSYKEKNKGKKSTKYKKPTIDFSKWGDDNSRCIILDESHNVKNHSARSYKVLNLHISNFKYRYLLTGTPTPNRFDEIYTQMKIVEPTILPDSYYSWISSIANIGNRFSNYAVNYVYKNKQEEWEQKFNPWVIRLKSQDVLDLPELYIKNIYAEMSDLQKQIYEHLIDYIITILKKENNGQLIPKLLMNKFAYISLAYENANLLKGKIDPIESPALHQLVEKFKFEKDHGKLEILDSLINTYLNDENKKTTVFDFHPMTLEILKERYKKYNPIVIHGQNTPKGREASEWRNEQLELFKNSKNHNLLLGSFKVLSTAINLTQCQRVIYFTRNYSYTDWSQSIKRFHRIGQDEPVIVNPLIFEDSLDVRLDGALRNKKDLDETIFDRDVVSKNDWKDIFKGKK